MKQKELKKDKKYQQPQQISSVNKLVNIFPGNHFKFTAIKYG